MNKRIPQLIAATMLTVLVMLGLMSCASGPPPGPINITTRPVPAGTLQGGTAVIFETAVAERTGASRQDGGRSGGLIGVFQVGAGIASVLRYNNTAKRFDEENAEDVALFLRASDALIAATWQGAYNANTVSTTYDFGRSGPRLNTFNNPNAALRREIAGIISEHNAEFAVTIVQQITHGYLFEGMAGTGNTAVTHISSQINVFNRNGDLIISALAKLPNTAADVSYGYRLTANNAESYAELYINNLANVLSAILSFDESAAELTVDDILDNLEIQLYSTAEVE